MYRYKCKICQKTSANYNFFHRHFQRKHNTMFDPANVIVFPQDKQIELWVTNVLTVQGKLLQETKDKPEDLSISDDEVKCVEDKDLTPADASKESICSSVTVDDVKPPPELLTSPEIENKFTASAESAGETSKKVFAGSIATGSPKKYSCTYCSYT